MYNVMRLNKKNVQKFKDINDRRNVFNNLNEDFFSIYDESNFAQQIFQRREVKLIFQGDIVIGYVWYTSIDKNMYTINSFYVNKPIDYDDYVYIFKLLTLSLKKNCTYIYFCEDNGFNCSILEKLSFIKSSGTIKMVANINNKYELPCNGEITFRKLEKNKDEKLRCNIQNAIFKSDDRVPLIQEDIYFDEVQDYYIDNGAIFAKYGDKYIGYGQFILEDNEPIIVNFGIVESFRGYGYSKLLLAYMLNCIAEEGYNRVYIKVDTKNLVAINLYSGMKFNILSERYNYILKK